MILLTKTQILMLHKQLIDATGGSNGVRDELFQIHFDIILSLAAGEIEASDLLKWIIMHQK